MNGCDRYNCCLALCGSLSEECRRTTHSSPLAVRQGLITSSHQGEVSNVYDICDIWCKVFYSGCEFSLVSLPLQPMDELVASHTGGAPVDLYGTTGTLLISTSHSSCWTCGVTNKPYCIDIDCTITLPILF